MGIYLAITLPSVAANMNQKKTWMKIVQDLTKMTINNVVQLVFLVYNSQIMHITVNYRL